MCNRVLAFKFGVRLSFVAVAGEMENARKSSKSSDIMQNSSVALQFNALSALCHSVTEKLDHQSDGVEGGYDFCTTDRETYTHRLGGSLALHARVGPRYIAG